jgi:hypothetical protein
MSVVAARKLVDELTGRGVRVFVVRDFDKAGFSIAATLTGDTRRYEFGNAVDVADAGLRLEDAEEYGLAAEPWSASAARWKVEANLRDNGATGDEIGFIVEGGHSRSCWGQRVELNAFTSDQFIEWLEAKLDEHGAGKVIPAGDILALQYRRALMRSVVNKKIAEVSRSVREDAGAAEIPGDLAGQVRRKLDDDPAMSWDQAVAEIAGDSREAPQDARNGP